MFATVACGLAASWPGWAGARLRKLDASVGRQDHTTSPSATCVVRLRAVNRSRARRTALRPRLRADAAASTASRPASVTIASRPSGGETAKDIDLIWVRRERKNFSNRGWTGFADLPPDGQICHLAVPPASKNISVPVSPKSLLELPPSHPTRGAYRDRHGRGAGCDGRWERD